MLVRNAQLQVVSTQPLIARLLEDALHARLPEFPAVSLVLDWPVGFAFQMVTPESAASSFVLTQNACPEYLDDLWNLGLLGLAYWSRTLEELAELLRRAETREAGPLDTRSALAFDASRRGLAAPGGTRSRQQGNCP